MAEIYDDEGLALVPKYQRECKNLVAYSRVHRGVYQMHWPEDSDGDLIPPGRLALWWRNRHLVLYCLCPPQPDVGQPPGEPPIVTLVIKPGGAVMAYCGHQPSRCGFRLNLSRIYRTTDLTDEYSLHPTRQTAFCYNSRLHEQWIFDEAAETGEEPDKNDLAIAMGWPGDYTLFQPMRGYVAWEPDTFGYPVRDGPDDNNEIDNFDLEEESEEERGTDDEENEEDAEGEVDEEENAE